MNKRIAKNLKERCRLVGMVNEVKSLALLYKNQLQEDKKNGVSVSKVKKQYRSKIGKLFENLEIYKLRLEELLAEYEELTNI